MGLVEMGEVAVKRDFGNEHVMSDMLKPVKH